MAISKTSVFFIWTYSKNPLSKLINIVLYCILNTYYLFDAMIFQHFLEMLEFTFFNDHIQIICFFYMNISYSKKPYIMKISIIFDPCYDFPAFFGNARIYLFFMAISKSSAFFIWTYSRKPFIIKISIILDPIFQIFL